MAATTGTAAEVPAASSWSLYPTVEKLRVKALEFKLKKKEGCVARREE